MEGYLDATQRGWYVFPLKPGTKTPAVKDWENWATQTPDPIWWSDPRQGYGIACGPSNLYVVDIDYSDHVNGYTTWYQLIRQHGLPPETYVAATPRQGLHIYYHCPNPPANTAGKIGPGIDTRGRGGYVVGYPPVEDLPTAPLPSWLRPTTATSTHQTPQPRRISGQTSRYGQSALTYETEKIRNAPIGTRNTQLNTSAYRIAQLVAGGEIESRHATEQIIYAAISAGLSEQEAIATTASAFNAQNLKPRTAR